MVIHQHSSCIRRPALYASAREAQKAAEAVNIDIHRKRVRTAEAKARKMINDGRSRICPRSDQTKWNEVPSFACVYALRVLHEPNIHHCVPCEDFENVDRCLKFSVISIGYVLSQITRATRTSHQHYAQNKKVEWKVKQITNYSDF